MKSHITIAKSFSVILPILAIASLILGIFMDRIFIKVPLGLASDELEIPIPPEIAPTAPTTDTGGSESGGSGSGSSSGGGGSSSGGGGSSSGGGGSSSGGSGGGSGGSSRSSSSGSSKATSSSSYSTTTAATFTKCADSAHPASDLSGNLTLTGLIDLFIVLGIIPQDRAAKACAVLINANTTTTSTQAFTKTLSFGETHADVTRLQQFLNARGFTVATTGAGAKGQESNYYGIRTTAAVMRFQEAYRAEILTPRGLQNGTGNFDQATMAKVNQLLGR